ncbi:hypothetical protein BDR06DRAFT_976395 [Suillus hirtellus]|nr:hypothetical protein BDR06DRAFT_976395 [Suillus hirtellus]
MSSQHQILACSSPKKRTKCKAVDSDGQNTSTKNCGLELKGLSYYRSLLNVPAILVHQPKSSTSLDSSIPTDPLKAAQRPQGKKATVMKTTSSVTAPNLQLSFTHHEAGAQFGFSPFIVAPGTEPDLQALNNSYITAAREKQALSILGTVPIPCLPLSAPRLQDLGYESLQTSSKGGNGDTNNEEEEEDHVDDGVGWGAVHGHMTAHPSSVNEVPMALLVEWLEGSQQVKEGIWPDHKYDMAKLLYEDLSMWCSELKKVVAGIVPSMYNLIPPS